MATKNPPIEVTYKYIDGAHFFVSDDKEALGLCVAHCDLKTAYEEVAYQLSALFEHNHNEETTFLQQFPSMNLRSLLMLFNCLPRDRTLRCIKAHLNTAVDAQNTGLR